MIKGLNALGMNLRPDNSSILSENFTVVWAMVKQGLGISIIDATIGNAEPLVQQVLPDLGPITFPIWLVAHCKLNTGRRIRVVFDFLAHELARP
ncbi:MAG: hypothetical protein L3J30_10535 [Marinosulfonomonas sp.]|nr:hypothetical protein [Marinosulfonomonas sp.]